jgi:subfamily B ATP-binding cassette protein MsbA
MNQPKQPNNPLSGWNVYKRLLVYVSRFWWAFLVSVLGFSFFALSQAGFAALIKYLPAAFDQKDPDCACSPDEVSELANLSFLPDFIQVNGQIDYQLLLPLGVIVIVILRGIGSYFGSYYITWVARNLVNALRQDLFARILILPSSFYSQNASGHLLSMITFNVEQVTGAATDALKTLVREGLTVIVLLGYIFYLNWQLSMIFLVVSPVIALVVSYTSKLFRRYGRRIQDSMGGVTHVSSEAIKGFQVVRAFGGNEYERGRFRAASENNLKQSLKLARVDEISTPLIQIIVFSAMALLFWLGLDPEFSRNMGTGEFLAYITAASMIAKPLRQLTSVNNKIQIGIAAAQSIFEVMDKENEPDRGTVEFLKPAGKIEFRNLSFRYPGSGEEVLKNINLTIEQGQTVAFVGRSGSGKSTLVNLLPRFNDVPANQLFIDGLPIEDYQLKSLRQQVAIVNQHVILFQDSVKRNIAYGDLATSSDEDIVNAATTAHAMEFIGGLPRGFDTQIGEDGFMLSGGQRQRLAMARAILKDAPVLILDEATSALDNESERYIQDALEAVMHNRTTLVIAHRLSTVEKADKIIVMDAGEIVETGTHAELLTRNGAYAQLHKMQFREN